MFKCYDCGKTFDAGEQHTWKEPTGERMSGCPVCGSAYGETKSCRLCGCDFLTEELHGDYCEDCLLDFKRNYEVLEKFSEKEKDEIRLPRLITETLSESEIETILLRYIEQNDIDCTNFIKSDFEWFAGKLIEMRDET